ncbi:MAG: hypothetical protein A2017_06535 [Lentisphaerae bacterium GWF2_44_16]|nr:MAG: hypothetical protein A2017_06535 [Lentisphaerae bacterium GWF2_44_16]
MLNITHLQYPSIRVLITHEANEVTAHALEFDIVSTGKDIKEAENNLCEAIVSQIVFAQSKDILDSIWHPAPKEYFDKWDNLQKAC